MARLRSTIQAGRRRSRKAMRWKCRIQAPKCLISMIRLRFSYAIEHEDVELYSRTLEIQLFKSKVTFKTFTFFSCYLSFFVSLSICTSNPQTVQFIESDHSKSCVNPNLLSSLGSSCAFNDSRTKPLIRGQYNCDQAEEVEKNVW